MSRNNVGRIPILKAKRPVTFEAGRGFVTAVLHIDDEHTVGWRFESSTQLLTFMSELLESATMAWPDDPFIKMYVDEP